MAGFGLGDLLAIGGALLYFVAKFLAFFTIDYHGVVSISTSLSGWSGSRGIWNLLEIILFVIVIAITVIAAFDILPAIGGLKGIILAGCGALLLIVTLLAFFDVRKVAADAGTTGGPGIGFILAVLFSLVIVVGGLMKMGIVPGDNAVSLGGAGGALPTPPDGAPFSSPYHGGAPGGPGPAGYAPTPGAPGNFGPPGGPRTAAPPAGSGGPYGPPPGGNRAPGGNNPPGGGYPAPPGGAGGYNGPPGGPQGPYGGPPQGAGGQGGYGGPPPSR